MAEWHRIITSPYTGSMSMSGSFNVDGDSTITGNVTINGTASVSNLIVKQIGYSSGSNQLGDAANDTQTLYGTVIIPTGSLTVDGNIALSGSRTISAVTSGSTNTGASLTLRGGTPTTGSYTYGGSITLQGGNAINPAGIGGDIYIYGGNGTGSQRAGYIYIGAASGQYQVYLQGAPIFNWDGPNASNAVLFQRGGGTRFLIYDDVNLTSNYYFRGGSNTINAIWDTWNSVIVKGKGTTSSTTAFQVQNANASSSLAVLDNGKVGVGTTTPAYQLSVAAPNAGDGIVAYVGSSGMIMTGNAGFGNPGITSTNGYIHVAAILNGTGGSEVLNVNKSANGAYIQAWRSFASSILTLVAGDGSIGIKTSAPSASLHVVGNTILSGSAGTGSALLVYKSGSTVLDIQGSSGQLFSVTDSLTGSLFSVNTVAGLPVIEAFSDNTVNIGKYGTYPIKVVSLGTSAVISGSFSGSGADLSGIPASAIVGLNLSQIATGSITASVSLGTGSFTIASGSRNFLFINNSGSIGISTSTPFSDIPNVGSGSIDLVNPNGNVTVGGFAVLGKTSTNGYGAVGSNYYLDNANALRRRNNDLFSAIGFEAGGFAFYSAGGGAVGSSISATYSAVLNSSGNFTIGNGSTTLGARIGIKGSGATSSTTSLLVQNSSAVSMLQVRDDNYTLFGPNGLGIDNFNCILYRSSFNAQSISFHLSRLSFADATGFVFSNSYSSTPAASAIFDIQSTAKGFLLPRTNLTSNLSAPAQGLMTYVTASATEGLYYYNSGSYQSWTKVLNSIGTQTITGSLSITGSAGTGSALTVYKSGSTVMSIQGSQGELFSITDSLSGSLFSVSNISGLPILEVFSDNTVLLGSYLDPMLITTQRLTANSGSTVIYSLPTASYDGVFVDYVIRSGSNARAGQFMGMWSGSSTNVVDSSTTDFGDTSGFVLALVVSGSNMVITGSASTSAWTVRAGIRSI